MLCESEFSRETVDWLTDVLTEGTLSVRQLRMSCVNAKTGGMKVAIFASLRPVALPEIARRLKLELPAAGLMNSATAASRSPKRDYPDRVVARSLADAMTIGVVLVTATQTFEARSMLAVPQSPSEKPHDRHPL